MVSAQREHFSLAYHKGTAGIWEARVSRSLRMTFQVEGDTAVLRNIGRHDETLENP